MFRAIILPILRSARLCITACGIMHPRRCRPGSLEVEELSSSASRLIEIINKLLLLHLVGCLYYLHQ